MWLETRHVVQLNSDTTHVVVHETTDIRHPDQALAAALPGSVAEKLRTPVFGGISLERKRLAVAAIDFTAVTP